MVTIADLYNKLKERDQKIESLIADNVALMHNNHEFKRALEAIELVVLSLDEDYDVYENNFYHLRAIIRGTKETISKRHTWEQMPFKSGPMPICCEVEVNEEN